MGMVPRASTSASTGLSPEERDRVIVLRLVRATLERNLHHAAKLDPYALVFWESASGCRKQISRTAVHVDGHLTPHWDHVCRGQRFKDSDTVEVQVWDSDLWWHGMYGKATVQVAELSELSACGGEVGRRGSMTSGFLHTLPLECNDEPAGSLVVHVLFMRSRDTDDEGPDVRMTLDPCMFESPVKRLGVSGGTAPFFGLHLRSPKPGQSPKHFVGKDLSHSCKEHAFYEETLATLRDENSGLVPLLSYTLEFAGVVSMEVEEHFPEPTSCVKDLLVMRNMRDGLCKLRLTDVKVGQITAQAGWHGKSRFHALKQAVLDGHTNSQSEGFRLEGFDGVPPVLSSMDPLLDIRLGGSKRNKLVRKAMRIMLQRFTACEMFVHFCDTHQEPADPGTDALGACLAPVEVGELALHEIVARLIGLAVACRRAPVPQKWLGSSVALGFDVGFLPNRVIGCEEEVRRKTLVHIFDWGRSELNTLERHNELTEEERQDRVRFWQMYVGGIDRLSWEAARAYRHRFSNAGQWRELQITLFDFDSMTSNDFIGRLVLPVEEMAETVLPMCASGREFTLTMSMTWRRFPVGSRLKGCWRVHIVKADGLPDKNGMAAGGGCDPFCEIIAVSADQRPLRLRQRSMVKVAESCPVWDEIFDLPVAAQPDALRKAMQAAVPDSMSNPIWADLLPPERSPTDAIDQALEAWTSWLDDRFAGMSPRYVKATPRGVGQQANTCALFSGRVDADAAEAPFGVSSTLQAPGPAAAGYGAEFLVDTVPAARLASACEEPQELEETSQVPVGDAGESGGTPPGSVQAGDREGESDVPCPAAHQGLSAIHSAPPARCSTERRKARRTDAVGRLGSVSAEPDLCRRPRRVGKGPRERHTLDDVPACSASQPGERRWRNVAEERQASEPVASVEAEEASLKDMEQPCEVKEATAKRPPKRQKRAPRGGQPSQAGDRLRWSGRSGSASESELAS